MTTVAQDRVATRRLDRFRTFFHITILYAAGFAVLTIGSFLTLTIAVVTLFQARRVYAKMAQAMARIALWLGGVRFVVHRDEPLPTGQAIYIANHGSTLDIFILTAMGLPNVRFFLSGYLRKKLPLGLLGYLTGVFWTVPQKYPEKRVKIFKRAERVLLGC